MSAVAIFIVGAILAFSGVSQEEVLREIRDELRKLNKKGD